MPSAVGLNSEDDHCNLCGLTPYKRAYSHCEPFLCISILVVHSPQYVVPVEASYAQLFQPYPVTYRSGILFNLFPSMFSKIKSRFTLSPGVGLFWTASRSSAPRSSNTVTAQLGQHRYETKVNDIKSILEKVLCLAHRVVVILYPSWR